MATTYAIPNGAQYMAATLYTGTGAALTATNGVAGQSFQPDMLWVKNRSATSTHILVDSVRGVSNVLTPNTTTGEQSLPSYVTSLNTNGFSIGTGSGGSVVDINSSGNNYVGWNFKAGGTAVSNTAGSITSSVSANTTSGFSVVTYTGNGTSGATVGHGLGATPTFMIVKVRNSINDWMVYSPSIGVSNALFLNLTDAATASSSVWNSTAPTSSVFTLGFNIRVNGSGNTYVAYCWAPIAGYSAFGSYTGNGSTDGAFIYTGFRPKFLLIKSTGVESWEMFDTSRDTYNQAVDLLEANSSGSENTSSTSAIDILSNGFKQRNTRAATNGSGQSYIYAAFAENPFKYANAR